MNIETHLNEAIDHTLDLFFFGPFLHYDNHEVASLVFLFALEALDPPALINDPFEEALKAFIIQRASIAFLDPPKNFTLPLRVINPQVKIMLDLADLNCTL